MNLIDKVMTLVDTVKFAAEDAVYSVRNKVLDAVAPSDERTPTVQQRKASEIDLFFIAILLLD